MVGYKLSKNDWVTPFFVIFRSVREILLVTVFCKHPVLSKLPRHCVAPLYSNLLCCNVAEVLSSWVGSANSLSLECNTQSRAEDRRILSHASTLVDRFIQRQHEVTGELEQ